MACSVTTKIFSKPKASASGFKTRYQAGGRTIGIGDDEAGVVAAIFLLARDGVEMGGVHFWNEKRNVGGPCGGCGNC